MGRDKPKKYGKMGYFESQNYYREKAKDYNINLDQFENSAHGGGRYEDFDDDALKNAVRNAQRNDIDYRTSAQHMDGVKGDGSFGDFNKYERAAHKLHRKAGNEGDYSSIKDITTVTNNLVNDDRRSQTALLDKFKNDINGLRNNLESSEGVKSSLEAEPLVFEDSDRVASAKNRLDEFKLNLGEQNLFAKSNDSAPRADDQADATAAFTNKYKNDVKEASNLGETVASNLNNAMDTVKNSYRHKFMSNGATHLAT